MKDVSLVLKRKNAKINYLNSKSGNEELQVNLKKKYEKVNNFLVTLNIGGEVHSPKYVKVHVSSYL